MHIRRAPALLAALAVICVCAITATAAPAPAHHDARSADGPATVNGRPAASAPLSNAVTAAEHTIRTAPFAATPLGLSDGLDYLRGLVKNALRMAWNDDPDFPRMETLTAADGKVGLDNPDAVYMRAPLRDDAEYVITGTRSTVRDLSFQIMSGDYLALPFPNSLAAFTDHDFTVAPDGRYTVRLSPHCAGAPNCVTLPRGSATLLTREVFSNWDTERRGTLAIRRSDRAGMAPAPSTPEREAARYRAAAAFVTGQVRLWLDFTHQYYGQLPVNTLSPPRSTTGGLPTQYSSTGTYRVADDEALVVTVPHSSAAYQGIQLGNDWYESLDYVNHVTSLTADQARTDPDGRIRFVVSRQDPGLANWLETTGHTTGYLHLRWQGQSQPLTAADQPTVTVVKLADLPQALPYYARDRSTPEQHRQVVAARQLAVADRMIG